MNEITQDYHTPGHPIAFSGPQRIKDYYKIKRSRRNIIDNVLSKTDAYTLHRQYKKTPVTNPFFAYGIREQYQMDLIEVGNMAEHNDGVNYLFVCIDQFSKKGMVLPMQKKTAKESMRVISAAFTEMGIPKTIVVDRGKEFTSKEVMKLLENYKVKTIHPNNDFKAGTAERFNRTIQDLIYRYLTHTKSERYIDVLQDLVKTYNSRLHRSLGGLSPNEAEDKVNHFKVRRHFNDRIMAMLLAPRKKPHFKVNDRVRIKKIRGVFDKGYKSLFSTEIFQIMIVNNSLPITMYSLKDLEKGEVIEGQFYENELQKVT